MWADSFLRAEQQHALLLLVWSALSVLAGTAIALLLVAQDRASILLANFAKQLAGWGIVIIIVVALERHGLRLRDVASATRVERLLWMRIGFDVGIVGMGTILTIAGRRFAPVVARSAPASQSRCTEWRCSSSMHISRAWYRDSDG